jgi:hypothetical protein
VLMYDLIKDRLPQLIDVSDEAAVRRIAEDLAEKRWLQHEIARYLRWTEYYEVTVSEERCLTRMKVVSDQVNERLSKAYTLSI